MAGESIKQAKEALKIAIQKLGSNDKFNIITNAIAAFKNQLGMIKIDLDPVTGVASYQGHAVDSQNFETAVRAGLLADATGFGTKILTPFSKREDEWVVKEDGYYAPVLITEQDRLFVMGHDLATNSTHSRYIGENTIGFEDMALDQNPDFDFNDAIITFNKIA